MELLADRYPTAQGGHVRLHPRLIDEDKTRRIKPALVSLRLRPTLGDRGTELFGGQHAFFWKLSPSMWAYRHSSGLNT